MEFLIILFLLLLNGLFAMYEIALVSSSKARLETMAGKGNKSAKGVLRQLEEPEKFLSTIQIGITLIGIISGAFGGVTIANQVAPFFEKVPALAPYAGKLAMISVVGVITYLSLVVGELVPKSIALSNPERYATLLCPFMILLTKVSYPFVWLLSASTRLLNKIIGVSGNEDRNMTEEELKFILRQSTQQGVIEQEETEMLYDVFRFTDKKAKELMTHRKDLIFLHANDTREDVLDIIKKNRFSKYPVIGSDIEEIFGTVSAKDIAIMAAESEKFDLMTIIQPPLFIPENLYAAKILELFKLNKNKFGFVVNEYGNIEGVTTLYDLTESFFGDILEEDEQEDAEIVIRQNGSMLVEGSMNISDFMEEVGVIDYDDIRSLDFTTLGGLTMHLIERMPKAGDIFEYKNLIFEVVDMDGGRVDKLLVTKKDKPEE